MVLFVCYKVKRLSHPFAVHRGASDQAGEGIAHNQLLYSSSVKFLTERQHERQPSLAAKELKMIEKTNIISVLETIKSTISTCGYYTRVEGA